MSEATTPEDAIAPGAVDEPAVSELYGVPLSDSRGQRVLHPTREGYLSLLRTLLDETFTMAADLSGVDYLQFMDRALPDGIARERFEVVVNVLSIERRERMRIRVQVPASDPTLPSAFDLYPGV